jgi:hypothetical protein
MTTLTLEPTSDLHLFRDGDLRRPTEDARGGGRSAFGGGEATLADVVAGAWEDLAAARAVACPVCAGELAPHVVTAAGDLVAARCGDCGAELD